MVAAPVQADVERAIPPIPVSASRRRSRRVLGIVMLLAALAMTLTALLVALTSAIILSDQEALQQYRF